MLMIVDDRPKPDSWLEEEKNDIINISRRGKEGECGGGGDADL